MLRPVAKLLNHRSLFDKYFWFKITKTSIAVKRNDDCLTYCKRLQLYGTLKQSVVHDLCADINIEELRAQQTSEEKTSSLADAVQKEIELRLNNAVKQFDEWERKLFKIVQLEHSFLFSEGYAIPPSDLLSNRNWLEAMTIPSMEERLQYYSSLERIAEKQRNSTTEDVILPVCETVPDDENENSIFLQILTPMKEERLANHRLASALLYGIVLVVDLGFDEHQLSTDIDPLVSQLWNLYLVNASNPQPFHLVFTNCNFAGPTYRHLLLTYLVKRNFVLATFSEKSHTEMFPSESLVYLSSQSNEILHVFNPNRTYIIGAYHDPVVHKKLSLAKARQEKLQCVKLPIDHHVKWAHQAHKDLNLDSMVGILLSAKHDGLWKKAFVSVVPHLVNQTELLDCSLK